MEYVKTILLKVSFESMLFEKELRKGLKVLGRENWRNAKYRLFHVSSWLWYAYIKAGALKGCCIRG